MSSSPDTLAFLLDQLGELPGLRTRRMFGEYCVYVDDKPVGFVCDDLLYVKPTEAGQALMNPPVWGSFYEKVKPHLLVTPDRWDERDWLRSLLLVTAEALPRPKPKTSPRPSPKTGLKKKPKAAKPKS